MFVCCNGCSIEEWCSSDARSTAAASMPASALVLLQDAEMMEQINRDVMRTHPDMHFFSGDDPKAVQHREVLIDSPSCL